MSDDYVKVKVILVARTKDAILVSRFSNDVNEPTHWIPLSLLHIADERRIDNSQMTEPIEFRMRAWKAAKLNL